MTEALSPWADLAQRAREIAELAERYETMPAAGLAPTGSREAGDLVDPFDDLRIRALALVGLAADCRLATWRQLHDDGASYTDIGRLWGVSSQAVQKKFSPPVKVEGAP